MSLFDDASIAYSAGEYLHFLRIVVEDGLAHSSSVQSLLPNGFDMSILWPGRGADRSLLMEFAAELWNWDELRGIDALKEAAAQGSVDAIGALGRAYLWMGDAESAREWLERALAIEDCDSPDVRGDLGEALWALSYGDSTRIESLLRSGASVSPHYGVTLSKLLVEQGRYDEARELLERLVEGGEYGAAIRLGNLLDAQFGDTSAAEHAYLKGVESGDGFSAFNLAILRHGKGDFEAAEYYRTIARAMGVLTIWPDEDLEA